jgi:hypothetical protein
LGTQDLPVPTKDGLNQILLLTQNLFQDKQHSSPVAFGEDLEESKERM